MCFGFPKGKSCRQRCCWYERFLRYKRNLGQEHVSPGMLLPERAGNELCVCTDTFVQLPCCFVIPCDFVISSLTSVWAFASRKLPRF